MKRIVAAVLLIIGYSVGVSAQTQAFKQSTASPLLVLAQSQSSGLAATTTGSIPNGFTISLTKQSDAGVVSATRFTPTLATGTAPADHSCYAVTNGQEWSCKLAATDVDTLGRLEVCWSYPGAYDDCKNFTVISSIDWDANIGGNLGDYTALAAIKTQTDKFLFDASNYVKSDLESYKGTASPTADTAGYPPVTHKSGTGTGEILLSSGKVSPAAGSITVTEAPNLNATVSSRGTPPFKVGVSKQVSLSFKSGGTAVAAGHTVTCKIAKDAPISSASGASHNSPSATTDYGSSEITFDGATDLTSVTDYMNYHCVESGGVAIDGILYVNQ